MDGLQCNTRRRLDDVVLLLDELLRSVGALLLICEAGEEFLGAHAADIGCIVQDKNERLYWTPSVVYGGMAIGIASLDECYGRQTRYTGEASRYLHQSE